ncbi:hypothetical protein ABW20_dc0105623 [Dactylellina cionopaga]|nr:hypothetical protein ABW20_dc0105623 [Dactylellina cionopaga]
MASVNAAASSLLPTLPNVIVPLLNVAGPPHNVLLNPDIRDKYDLPKRLRSRWYSFIFEAQYVYEATRRFRHRDAAGRVIERPLCDRYIHHGTGKLRKLVVACTDDIHRVNGTATWRRTYVKNGSALKVRIATWVIDYDKDPGSVESKIIQMLRALPAAISLVFCFWTQSKVRHGAFYAPVEYQYHGDAKLWRNSIENRTTIQSLQEYRILKPRHLCFLKSPEEKRNVGVDVRSVSDWENAEGQDLDLSYIFVAYSAAQFNHASGPAMHDLHQIAEAAARSAGVLAYWTAASCMRNPAQVESDVYRIADVLRGSRKMVIVVGQPDGTREAMSTDDLLKAWGNRMWTFPEVLLSPGRQISVYIRGEDMQNPLIISKNQFAGRVWTDASESRQLIDSYLGNLALSRLEQAVIALNCLYRRQTTQYLAGDQAYALMGLLRLKPGINYTDTQFQAFSRLSTANDSDMLLERYLCTLPLTPQQPWHNMEDAYHCALWDINPYTQVAAICENDTVILDGAYAAGIRWKGFYAVAFATGTSFKRTCARILLRINSCVLLIALLIVGKNPTAGGILVAIGFLMSLCSPRLIRRVYGGKVRDVQAALFAVEGYINVATAERAIFGGSFGRMTWSVNGSPLSRSGINQHGERVGVNPTRDPAVQEKVDRARHARPGEMRVFTLVDTYNMQVTLFEAVRPPTVVILCASEGGMQRAIGCSYDWTTSTMYRETVFRMPTASLQRMNRIPRVRIGLQKPEWPSQYKGRPAGATAV